MLDFLKKRTSFSTTVRIILILFLAVVVGGIFTWREYREIAAEQQYAECTIECEEESHTARNGAVTAEIVSRYESCIDNCVQDYQKITGKEITPIYKIIKESME